MRSPSGTERIGSESHQPDPPQAKTPSSENWSIRESKRNKVTGEGLKHKHQCVKNYKSDVHFHRPGAIKLNTWSHNPHNKTLSAEGLLALQIAGGTCEQGKHWFLLLLSDG